MRELQLYLNPHAEHLRDWFHVTMRLTVLQQTAKGSPDQTRDEEQDYPLRDPVVRELERLKWYLWHGNVYKALQVVQSIEMDLDAAVATSGHGTARKLLKAVEEFHTYIENNQGFIPNYGERYRHGESGDQQALLQKAADGLDPTRGASPGCSPADGGVTPQNQTLSLDLTVVGPVELPLGDWGAQLSPPGRWVPSRDSGIYCWLPTTCTGVASAILSVRLLMSASAPARPEVISISVP